MLVIEEARLINKGRARGARGWEQVKIKERI